MLRPPLITILERLLLTTASILGDRRQRVPGLRSVVTERRTAEVGSMMIVAAINASAA